MAGPALDSTLMQYFAEQCWVDAHSRLLEAGADSERGVWLPDVFVDLNVSPCRSNRAGGSGRNESDFDRSLWIERKAAGKDKGIVAQLTSKTCKLPNRIVLLGGPGSGKSTITSMVQLALRARALKDTSIDEDRRQRLGPVLDRAAPFAARATRAVSPMRVLLPRLAAYLSENPAIGMGDYFAAESRRLDKRCEVARETFEQHVALSASVLWLFDGLDEVPVTAGRAAVLDAAMRWVRKQDSLIVTTRPQAYVDELDDCDAFVVQELDDEQVQRLGRQLVPHWSNDPNVLPERLVAFETAVKTPEVRELANSPLQTLLLAITIASSGDLPRLRAKIFASLFEVLFKREIAKPNAVMRRDDQEVLLALHRRVGIALQARGETAAGSTATMTARELRRLIVEMLVDDRIDRDVAERRADELIAFAADRLVLLERASDREFSFAVRSIQEYFAADALADHPAESVVSERVAALAPRPYWRNTAALVASHAATLTRHREQPHALAATAGACDATESSALGRIARLASWTASLHLAERGVTEYSALRDALETREQPLLELEQFADDFLPFRRAGRVLDGRAQSRLAKALREVHSAVEDWRLEEALHNIEWRVSSDLRDEIRTQLMKQATRGTAANRVRLRSFAELWREDTVVPAVVALKDGNGHRCSLDLAHGNVAFFVTTIASSKAANEIERTIAADDPMRDGVLALRTFVRRPSKEHLAAMLDAIAPQLGDWIKLADRARLPWPIDACIRWADHGEDVIALADAARRGDLGDTNYFIETDRALSAKDQHERAIERSDSAWPIGPTRPGFPVAGRRMGWSMGRLVLSRTSSTVDLAALSSLPVVGVNIFVAPELLEHLPVRHARSSAELLAVNAVKLTVDQVEHWISWADRRGRAREHFVSYAHRVEVDPLIVSSLTDALIDDPAKVGLWNALAVLVAAGVAVAFDELERVPAPVGANEMDHHIVALLGGWHELRSDESQNTTTLLLRAIRVRGRAWRSRDESLVEAIAALPDRPANKELVETARSLIARRPTPVFATPDRWTRHQLPGSFPGARGARPPTVIVTIDAIENIRVFAKTPAIDAKLPTPAPGRGQWIVIIGENGAGKTTLLRSLAFALATPAASGQLVTGHPSFIRNSGDGIVGVTLDSTPLRVRLRRNEKGTLTFLEEQEPYSARPWVVGYGVQRAGATGEPDRKPLYDETGALGSLFDLPYALTNAKAFLTRADHNALSEERKQGDRRGPKNRLWNELRAAMQQLLGVHSIEVDDGVWVRLTETSPRVAFDTLSHGYLSMAGWVSDLVARWLERLEDLDDEYPANIFATMTGIVLVDEIDMHLHPRWQLTVIEDLRKLFPRLTFVATTHNPLTLHGAQPGEIFVLTKDATGAPILQQRDIRPGSDVDRVLFDVFGVHQTFDKTTRDLLEQHRALVQRGVPFDSDERTAIERQLRERLGAIGALINEQRGGSSDVDDDMRALAQQRAKSKPVAATTPKKTTDTKKKPKRSG